MRQKGDDSAHAAQHAVDQEAPQGPVGHPALDPMADRLDRSVDPLHRRFGPEEDRLEDEDHQDREHQHSPQGMGQHVIDPIASRGAEPLGPRDRAVEHPFGPIVADPGLDPRDPAAGRLQPQPRRLQPVAQPAFLLTRQGLLDIAVDVQQQSFHQVSRQRIASAAGSGTFGFRGHVGPVGPVGQNRLQAGDLVSKCLGKQVFETVGPAADDARQGRFQLGDAGPAVRLDRDHGNRQPLGQSGQVDFDGMRRATSSMLTAKTVGSPNSSTWLTR